MTLTRLLSPLTSLVIFILGHGMFNTLLTVRLFAEQVSVQAIGLVSGAYFWRLVLGGFVNALGNLFQLEFVVAGAQGITRLACVHGIGSEVVGGPHFGQ